MRKKKSEMIPALSEKMKEILTGFSNSRTLPSGLVLRSKIVLMSYAGISNQKIGKEINLHYINVAKWRTRFIETVPILIEIEAMKPEKLSEAITNVLSDQYRCGTPSKYTPEQITKIINLACTSPKDYEHEVTQWSIPLLVNEIKNQGIADDISVGSVWRFLKDSRFKAK